MKGVSNNAIAMLVAVLILLLSLEISMVWNIKYEKISPMAVGIVGFCADNDPKIEPIPDMTAYVGEKFTYDVDVTGDRNGTVTFYDDTNLFDIDNETGLIDFTPTENDIGEYYINISVESVCGRISDWYVFKLTVRFSNRPPELDFIPDQTVYQNELFVYDVNATDPDNDTLFFGDNTTMFQINSETGLIYFVPTQEDVGNHSVIIWVMDEHEAIDWQTVKFEIIDVNDPPVLDHIGSQTAIINETYRYDVNATDVDTTLPHNLTFYDNATFFDIDNETGMIEFFVNESYNGTYWVNISVTDGELWDWELVSFSVIAVNHPPNVTSWYPKEQNITIKEGESQYFNITKFDLDGTIPSTQWYLDGKPLAGQTEDEYTYFASYTSSGIHNITVIITDGLLNDSHEWRLEVIDVPTPAYAAGPSTTQAPPSCIENWRCSEWSVCPVYEIQTRKCWDLNNCGTTFHKPIESRKCKYVPQPSCSDGVRNCHHGSCEILIDCGGPCPPCPSCSDGIKNCHKMYDGRILCEEDIDCGGPCPPCPIGPRPPVCGNDICESGEIFSCPQDCGLYFVQFLLIIVIISGSLVLGYRGMHTAYVIYKRRKKPIYTEKQILGILTMRKLHLLRLELGKRKPEEISKDLAKAMRRFFSKMFDVEKTFTYIELAETARKKIPEDLANEIMDLSVTMTELEYKIHKPSVTELAITIKKAITIIENLIGIKIYQALDKKVDKELKKLIPKEKRVEARTKEHKITKKEAEEIKKLERLIIEAEDAVEKEDLQKAEKLYTEIREIYDSLDAEVKRKLYDETMRIIKIYREIIRNV